MILASSTADLLITLAENAGGDSQSSIGVLVENRVARQKGIGKSIAEHAAKMGFEGFLEKRNVAEQDFKVGAKL